MRTTRRGLLAAAGWTALPVMGRGPDSVPRDQRERLNAQERGLEEEGGLRMRGRRLKNLLDRPESARHVAAAWLAGTGETDSLRAAMNLKMNTVLAPMDEISGDAARRSWLGARIRNDFTTGAVLDVNGWLLSRTEVGACLLVTGAA